MPTKTRSTRTSGGFAARLALAAIRGYQRFISPHKGFSCALRVATGGAGCSAHGYAMIARFGLRRGLALLDRRLALCSHAHARLRAAAPPAPPPAPTLDRLHRQRGVCDVPCDCDLPHLHLSPCDGDHRCGKLPGSCSVFDLCAPDDCCDWNRKRRRERAQRNSRVLDAALERIRKKKRR